MRDRYPFLYVLNDAWILSIFLRQISIRAKITRNNRDTDVS